MGSPRVVDLLRSPTDARRRTAGYAIAIAGPVLVVLVLRPWRDSLEPITIGFTFLVVVVLAAAIGRLWPGIVAAFVSFLVFNFFFLPPYDTFVIARAEYVVALFVFLGLSVMISLLFARAIERADAAEEKEEELRSLQELSRDLVVRGPGEDTYRALLEDVVDRYGYAAAALFVHEPGEGLIERVVVRAEPGTISPSWNPADPGRAPERLPLTVGDRTLGLIVLEGERPSLGAADVRVLRAVCDQLALVLERDRLLRAATGAEVLKQTETTRRNMLAAVSHDLRSPLAAIKASVTDLLDHDVPRSDAERDAVLSVVDRETDRLDALVANLLDVSRIEAGVLRAHLETVDLAETITSEVDAANLRWPDIPIDATVDGHVTATADPVLLPRVLSNLLDNAARAAVTATAGDVQVVVGKRGERLAVRVIDHGPGLDPAMRADVFLPFARLDERATKLGPGLGLAIAKGFVDLMGGELWMEDTPGGGATFAFSLREVP